MPPAPAADGSPRGPTNPAEPPKLKNSLVLSRRVGACFRGGAVAVSRAEDRIACACGEEVKILDTETGIVGLTLAGDSEGVSALAWHPGGQQICVASTSLLTRVWGLDGGSDADAGACSCRIPQRPLRVLPPFHRRGQLTPPAADSEVGSGSTGDADGHPELLHSFRAHDMVIQSMEYDASGTPALLREGTALNIARCPSSSLTHKCGVVTGQFLATSDSGGAVRVWDAVRRYCTHNFPGHSGSVQQVAFHPDPEKLLLVSGTFLSLWVWRRGCLWLGVRKGRRVAGSPA